MSGLPSFKFWLLICFKKLALGCDFFEEDKAEEDDEDEDEEVILVDDDDETLLDVLIDEEDVRISSTSLFLVTFLVTF